MESIARHDGPHAPPELSSHDRLLRCAKRLFAADGYEHTTTSAIARGAGTSESQLVKHFGSKEGLLEAIFDEAWREMGLAVRHLLDVPGTPAEKLRRLTELMIGSLERDPELRTLMLLEGRRIRKRGHMIVLTRGFLDMVGVLDALLAELARRGELRPGLDPRAVRSGLIGAFEGLLRDQLLAERIGYPATYDGAAVRAAFAAMLGGLVAAAPAGFSGL